MNKKAENIINTTTRLFIKDGIKATTMDYIAKQAKVSKVTVYKYYSNKDTLYYEVGKYVLFLYIYKLYAIIKSEDNLVEKFYSFLAVLSNFSDTGHFELCIELIKYNDRLTSEYEYFLRVYKETLFYLIEEGIQKGLIKPSYDKQLVFHYINMGIVYYQQNVEYRNTMCSDPAFKKAFMTFHLNNIFIDIKKMLHCKMKLQ